METVEGTSALERRLVHPVLTIGNFDGLHLGHQAIIETVVERARLRGGEAVVFTFDPHPRKVLTPASAPRMLTTRAQKIELLEAMGVDVVILEPFDDAFARLEPETFVREFIHERIHPVEVYVGYDFHFGRDRVGSMRLLTETGPKLGFAVTIIPEVTLGPADVNSTRIRECLEEGAVEEVAALLGRPFAVRGEVVVGDRRGRTIGFPTANLASENEMLPASGVYAGHLLMLDDGDPPRDTRLPVVTNVGRRPTFEDRQGFMAEAHAIDWNGDLYGRRVELAFVHALRRERKFPGVEELKAQIEKDVDEARRRLAAGTA